MSGRKLLDPTTYMSKFVFRVDYPNFECIDSTGCLSHSACEQGRSIV
jgi:hypothetical protein